MVDKINSSEEVSEEQKATFDELTQALSDGIQMVLDNEDDEIEYVLCMRMKKAGLMGFIINTTESDALEMTMETGKNLYQSIGEDDSPIKAPEIILPH